MEKRYFIQYVITGISEYTKGEKRNFTYGPGGQLVKFENLCDVPCHITPFDNTRKNIVGWYKTVASAKRAVTKLTKYDPDEPDKNWKTEVAIICVEV